jgi:hypothetical protein
MRHELWPVGGGRDKARARDGETCKAASVLVLRLEMTEDYFLSAVSGILASARVILESKVTRCEGWGTIWCS